MIRDRLGWGLALVFVLFASGSALAEAPEAAGKAAPELYVKDKSGYRLATAEEKGHHAEAAGDHKSGGKLGFLDIKRYDLGIYTLAVFGLLYVFVQFLVWPKVAEGLKKREASIEGAREEAQKDRQTALSQLADAKRQLDEAAGKAKTMIDDAHKQAEASATRLRDEAAKSVEAAREQSRREIESAKDAARQELYREAVQLASLLSAKTIRRQLSVEDHSRLVDEALAELKTGVQRT